MFNIRQISFFIFFILLLGNSLELHARKQKFEKPFVIGKLECQLGNNLFQVAATCAHAWDNNAEPRFPDLMRIRDNGMPTNYAHVLFRCNSKKPKTPVAFRWRITSHDFFCHTRIPYKPNMEMAGTFHSQDFFARYRQELLDLFAPSNQDLNYIKNKYSHILNHPKTVGIQIRWFGVKQDEWWWEALAQYGYDFFNKAVAMFPDDTLFVVSSNDLEFARKNMPAIKNLIILEGEPYYIDFFILSMCKHNIISNSTFGWWAAWLNQNPDKIVVVPQNWVDPKWKYPIDVWPKEWIKINAKWGKPQDDIMSFR